MKNRSYVVGWLFLTLASLGWGQTPPCNTSTHWCGPYPLTGSADLNNLAFFTTDKSSQNQNSWGMTANDLLVTNQTPIPDVVPNGGIGQDQYLEAASKYVQAYERSTAGLPVFSKTKEGTPCAAARQLPLGTEPNERLRPRKVSSSGYHCGPRSRQLGLGHHHHEQHSGPKQ